MSIAAVPIMILAAWIIKAIASPRPGMSRRPLRGRSLTTAFGLWWRLWRYRNDPNTLQWGNHRVPDSIATGHLLVAGTTGSGKSLTLLRLFSQELQKRNGANYLFYDGKGDLLDDLFSIKRQDQRLITFDPFLKEGARWAIWRDVTDPAACNQVARVLFPKADHEHQPFFPESVQKIASSVMQTFVELKIKGWRLSHLLFVLRSADRIRQVLQLTPQGRDTLNNYMHTGETWANIMATLANRINDYEIVAALWDHAATEYSLREWAQGETILVLRKSAECEAMMDCMNRVLFTMAKRYLLSKPIYTAKRSWVVLDELASFVSRDVHKELGLLLEQGRAHNVAIVLGLQNIASLRDQLGVYGADRLTGLCSTKALLKVENSAEGEWSSGFFGNREEEVRSTSVTMAPSTGQETYTTHIDLKMQAAVLPEEFLQIPKADLDTGVVYYAIAPVGNPPLAYYEHVRGKTFRQSLPFSAPVDRPKRSGDQQTLAVTEQDLDRLLGGRLKGSGPSSSGGTAGRPTAPSPPTPPFVGNGASPVPSAPSTTPPLASAPSNPQALPPQSAPPPFLSGPAGAQSSGQATRLASSRGSAAAPSTPPQPGEIWDLAQGAIESVPSIWDVRRQ